MATLAAPNTGFDVDAILNNKQMSIKSVIAHANARYAIKDYNAAAELYSRATELQAEGNGEMSTKNADLLYLYGRCLYHVAVGNSDVLGSKVAGPKRDEEKPTPKPKRRKLNGDESIAVPVSNDAPDNSKRVAGESILQTAQAKKEDDAPSTAKPYFQFTGDENFDDSEDELAGDNPEVVAEEEEPDDDFSNAYEVLDLARLLLQRRLIEAEAEIEAEERQGNGEATALDTSTSDSIKQLKERLADTHDLQAEISLEGERFPAAVIDLRAALAIKQELFPQDSSILAEAHYKLSLALEFSSVTQQVMEGDNSTMLSEKQQAGHVDEVLREEAAKEMEAAIVSCKLRIEKEEMSLNAPANAALIENAEGKRPKITRESIDDVIDMVKDMEQRLTELREPPVSVNDQIGTGSLNGTNPLSGILGSILGESPDAQKARVDEATRNANDVSKLVKRKKSEKSDNHALKSGFPGNNVKRKASSEEDGEESEGGSKRPKKE